MGRRQNANAADGEGPPTPPDPHRIFTMETEMAREWLRSHVPVQPTVQTGLDAGSTVQSTPSMDRLRRSFKQFDVNGDGFLQRAEFKAMLQDIKGKEAVSDAEFEYVITRVDTDRSGSVDMEEYVAWVNTWSGYEYYE